MSLSLADMLDKIDPTKTILFFGSGSSIPSGAPSVQKLIEEIATNFGIEAAGYSLSEITGIVEEKEGRPKLISFLREVFKDLKVTGSLRNLPLCNWKNIYTTNYDQLIEQSFSRKKVPLSVISSNYDFREQDVPEAIKLYKLHGTIEKDYSDGIQSRIIITESDYDNTSEYREALYDALKHDLNGANLLIIGYSLADQHIKKIVNRAVAINNKSYRPGLINLILYTKDENRALLLEKRGIRVAFGTIDDFFLKLQKYYTPSSHVATDDPLDQFPILQTITIDIAHEIQSTEKNVGAMFQGWPATYADINAHLTFERSCSKNIESTLQNDCFICAAILGASGTGKSTLARQVMLQLSKKTYHCWEHKGNHKLLPNEWRKVATHLSSKDDRGILFIDDAHIHLYELNDLIDLLAADELVSLKIIITSARNQWNPRVKTPNIFTKGQQYVLQKLDDKEIENLLSLVDSSPDLRPLVEDCFSGFSRIERKRRLTVRCASDTFVCLKNIFASEQFDDIVLREFAELDEDHREIYRLVAAMESAGINVHRQLVIRLLCIPALEIAASLVKLTDIIHEYTISEREGIYGWKGRHHVIMDIITNYKMKDKEEYYNFLEKIIDHIIPTYDIEIRTIKQLCAFDSGISRFPDKHLRNRLLRKMISKAPGERVPRHRLISYLIDLNELDKAETEIRLFEKDFKLDGPVQRFRIRLLLARAERTPGILDEDRRAILEKARELAVNSIDRFKDNKYLLRTYCDVGIEYFKRTGELSVFDDAMTKMKDAEERIGDPEITKTIIKYERRVAGLEYENLEEEDMSD